MVVVVVVGVGVTQPKGRRGFLICCYLSYVLIVASLCFHEVIRFRLKLRHMS